MFSFFTRRKKIVIDCFTASPNAHDLFPIDKANKFYPDWWKRLPSKYATETAGGLPIDHGTMKSCVGFKNLYSYGFVIPLWSDLKLQTHGQNYTFQFADNTSQIGFHSLDQLGTGFSQYTHIKLISPWRIKEKSGVNFLYTGTPWNYPSDLMTQETLPGIVEYKYQHTSNVNMLLKKGQMYDFPAGKAMAHIVPMTEHDVEIKLHLVGPNDLMRVMNNNSFPFFVNGYMESRRIRKNKEDSKTSIICPRDIK
jgi:hypothetical protein